MFVECSQRLPHATRTGPDIELVVRGEAAGNIEDVLNEFIGIAHRAGGSFQRLASASSVHHGNRKILTARLSPAFAANERVP